MLGLLDLCLSTVYPTTKASVFHKYGRNWSKSKSNTGYIWKKYLQYAHSDVVHEGFQKHLGVDSTFQSWYQVATTPRWTWWTLHKWRSLSTRSRTRLILVTTFAITRADHNHHNHHQPNNINHHHQYHPPSQTRLTKVTTNLYYHQNIRAMLSNMQMWGSLWIKEVWAFNTYHPWLLSKKRPASLFSERQVYSSFETKSQQSWK